MKNKNTQGTDNNIPRLNFKNTLILMLFLFATFIIGMTIIEQISTNMLLPVIVILSLIIGYGIAFIQIKFQNKRELGKSFLWLGLVFTILAFVLLFGIYYSAVLF